MLELNRKLLEKIEELTLYNINLKNEIEGLKKGLEDLASDINRADEHY